MLYSLVVLLVIPFSLSWMTYNPLVQTFIARMATSFLSERLNTVVKIDGLYITPRLDLNARGFLVLDENDDTLFNAEMLFMDIRSFRLNQEKQFFSLNDISVSGASFTLSREQGSTDYNYQFLADRLGSGDTTAVADTVQTISDWEVSLNELDLENVRFRYIDRNIEPTPLGMDYANLDIFVNVLDISDLSLYNDTFEFVMNDLAARDRCGFVLDHMQGDFRLSPKVLKADSLIIRTPRSDIDLDLLFEYNGWPSYIYFLDEVNMQSMIRMSEVNLKDIGYYAPDLLVMDNELRIGGNVNGTVSNLKVSDFRFAFGRNTHFRGDVKLFGLPDIAETFIHTNVDELVVNKYDLRKFTIPAEPGYIAVPGELDVFGQMRIIGKFTGFINDFVSTAEFRTELGTIHTDVSLKQDDQLGDVVYNGSVHATGFNIGEFLNLNDYLGMTDLNVVVNGSGLTGSTVQMNMNGTVDNFEFLDNSFRRLNIEADIADRRFNGHLDVRDKLIKMVFDGMLDFSQDIPILDFIANIDSADLYRLNLLDRDTLSMLSAILNCNFLGLKLDDIEGRIMIDSLLYTEGDNLWTMDHLTFISIKDVGYQNRAMLTSDIIDASINGEFTYRELPYAINSKIVSEIPAWSFMPEPDFEIRPQKLEVDVTIKKTEDLTNIFLPGLFVRPESHLRGTFSSDRSLIDIHAEVPYVNYVGIQSDSIRMNLKSEGKKISFNMDTEGILLKEGTFEDTLELGFEDFSLSTTIFNDSLKFQLGWDNHEIVYKNKADVKGYFTYLDSTRSELRFTHSDIVINDTLWTIDSDNHVTFSPGNYVFNNVSFSGSNQKLALEGKVSKSPQDTLLVEFNNWRISNFDIIFRNYNFDLNGRVNGSLGLNDLYGSPNFFSRIGITNLEMNDILIGDANIYSTWNDHNESIDILSEIIFHGNVGDSRVVALTGSYFPEKTEDNLDFELYLQNYRLETLERFVADYISDLSGIASGNFRISGSTTAPSLHGKLKLMRTQCRIDYLNTKYSLAHTIDFNPGEIDFKDLIIYDSVGNQAVATGHITHRNLSDINFDINLLPTDFICLQTDRYQNNTFYGMGIASGKIRFYGPMDDFHIDADVITSKGTNITIPLNNTITVTDNDFVVFRKEDTLNKKDYIEDYSVNLKGLYLDFHIEVTNAADVMIFLPSDMGNISSKGFGDIRFTINPRGDFQIFGDYNFLRGTFFFTLQNLINRRFEILQGGKISFTGNPYNSDLSLKALYRLKTSLNGLGTSISPEYAGQRINVNAYLGLRGKLANPDIRFSIGFPNVRSEIKQTIYAVLDTNDRALMNTQMLSLLMMNSFSYASGSANLPVSSLNIISSQLSNWLSQISNDVDIGINYNAGDEINQDELEVALSTQFFDNRLIVDGNVGVITNDKSQQQASNIVGDVNIEYKLRPDGRVRLKAFNRSNNINTIDYYSPYTQGVGIFYTKEFDRFGDVFRRTRKKDRQTEIEYN